MAWTNAYARFATVALFIVDYGQIIYHSNCILGAFFCAQATGNTTNFARAHNFFALAMRRASDVNGSRGGNARDNVFRTSQNARSTTYASVGVNFSNAVFNFYAMFGANGCAVATAKTTKLANFVAT